MKKLLILFLTLLTSLACYSQGAHDFRFSEVYLAPEVSIDSYEDEYGDVDSWIEIENVSYTTHDIRNCFLTTDRRVLDKSLSAPEREKLMSQIPAGDERTTIKGRQRITFFADGRTNLGTLHTNFTLKRNGEPVFLALYDGNAVDLLDSLTVPADLASGNSWSKLDGKWQSVDSDHVTPNAPNSLSGNTNKIKEWKEKDPHGIAMTVLSMTIVFSCLALLYVFFRLFGWILNRMNRAAHYKAIKKLREEANKVLVIAKDGVETRGIEMENYVAAISLAMHEYLGNTHDIESGVITIVHTSTEWESKQQVLTPTPEIHLN